VEERAVGGVSETTRRAREMDSCTLSIDYMTKIVVADQGGWLLRL
jgi:hypothetical protein